MAASSYGTRSPRDRCLALLRFDWTDAVAQPTHKKRAVADRSMRLALMDALAPIVSRMTTEEVHIQMGTLAGTASQLRHDIGDIKARRTSALGLSRLLIFCEGLAVDAFAVIAAAAARRLAS